MSDDEKQNKAKTIQKKPGDLRPETPLKDDIVGLRKQIQVLSEIQQIATGPQARDEAPLTSFMRRLTVKEPDLTTKEKEEHAMQNMTSLLDKVSEDMKERATKQFKIYQFCSKIQTGEFDYDLYHHAKCHFLLPEVKACEFLTLSPNSSAILIRRGDQAIDVLNTNRFDFALRLSPDTPKCIELNEKFIFLGLWTNRLAIYHVHESFRQIKSIKMKAGVRALCILN